MLRSAMAGCDIKEAISKTIQLIEGAYKRRAKNVISARPVLVAVSKTKPVEDIVAAYEAGQRHFGENYVQELVEKASNAVILAKCENIQWHFIGHLQNNKVNKIVKVPGLHMIQTIDSEKLAANINNAWSKIDVPNLQPLSVLVQVNTSGEEGKNGVQPAEAVPLYKHILQNLSNLCVKGVMTIGRFDHDYSLGPNPDFLKLMQCQNEICKALDLKTEEVLVSMGMSGDFEQAVEMGSSVVRVGSSIFGARMMKN